MGPGADDVGLGSASLGLAGVMTSTGGLGRGFGGGLAGATGAEVACATVTGASADVVSFDFGGCCLAWLLELCDPLGALAASSAAPGDPRSRGTQGFAGEGPQNAFNKIERDYSRALVFPDCRCWGKGGCR